MSTKSFLSISAVIGIAYALGFLIAPEAMADIYGVLVNQSSILEIRFFGTALLGLGLIFANLRNVTDRAVLRGLLTAFAISNAAGIGVSAWGTMSGVMNQLGWSATAIYALLLVGCFVTMPE